MDRDAPQTISASSCAGLRVACIISRHRLPSAISEQAFHYRRSVVSHNGAADRQTPDASDGFSYLLERGSLNAECLSIRPGNALMGQDSARLCTRADSSGRRSRVDGTLNATGARLDCSLGDDFPGPSVRMGSGMQSPALCFWWLSLLFSPWPAPQCPIFSRRPLRWWQWNVWQLGKPNRSGARAWWPPSRWPSQALRARTSCFFCLSRHSFCLKASNPGRFWHRSGGSSGFGLRLSQASFYCWESFLLSVSITADSPWPLSREHSIYQTIFIPICCTSCFLYR